MNDIGGTQSSLPAVHGFKVVHHNIQGLSNKLDSFQMFLDSENPDIICLSEHHLRDFEFEVMALYGFKGVTAYCRSSFQKGGVCIFSKPFLRCEVMDVSNFCVEGMCEIAAVKLDFNKTTFQIIVVYKPRPFSSSLIEHETFNSCLSNCLVKLQKPNVRTLVVGDFNVDLSVSDVKVDRLVNMMTSHGLRNRVTSFTREFKQSKTLIDHVYSDLPDDSLSCSVLVTALSDHHAQVVVVKSCNGFDDHLFGR